MNWYEILGYVASVLVAFSLTQRSVLRLRLINLAGAIAFTLYGLLIQAYPVMAVNFFIVLINLYYLREMLTAREYFQILEVNTQSAFLRAFLRHYQADMNRFYPHLDVDTLKPDMALIVLRDMVPAGVYLGHRINDTTLLVDVDYVTPQYRDFKTGRFIYEDNRHLFDGLGITHVHSTITPDADYLRRMGFENTTSTTGESLLSKRIGT